MGHPMLHDRKVIVVLPAYRARKTLARTVREIPRKIVDEIILVDDASDDDTLQTAKELGIQTFVHSRNLGYGANQKTCYLEALRADADIVVMLHPDYQYDPRLVTPMAGMIASGVYDVVIGSRILGNTARDGGMPIYKYISNRILTASQNFLMGTKLSEFHTGYRAFSRQVLTELPLLANSDDFVFDNQVLTQVVSRNFRIGEISCPTRYFPEASSIGVGRSMVYGVGCLRTSMSYRLWKWGLLKPAFLSDRPELRLSLDDR
jgi:glycosyltransferase involved in cell wall biosynthesis